MVQILRGLSFGLSFPSFYGDGSGSRTVNSQRAGTTKNHQKQGSVRCAASCDNLSQNMPFRAAPTLQRMHPSQAHFPKWHLRPSISLQFVSQSRTGPKTCFFAGSVFFCRVGALPSHVLSMCRVFGEGVKSARAVIAILAAATTLETCWNLPSHELFQANYCTRTNRNNAIGFPPLRTIVLHERLHELLRQKATIAATPLAESTPSPNSQMCVW